ncbi:recombinase [Massilia arenosa]|uniref:Recombinase n=1 Tax=Zemynaea arenosa TaxID=2561931 RepID=A0A4Y9S7V7_9BURK|nr:site-specific recombinase [Massilia arenosa]TFW17637.1 recombinase [Massilia arenosa]
MTSLIAVLDRIDPDSARVDTLVSLVDALRPRRASDVARAAANVRTLTQLLRGDPRRAADLRQYLTNLLVHRRHTSLYTDIGILSNDGFFTELRRRLSYRALPPALNDLYLSDTVDQVLSRHDDHVWISGVPAADWYDLFDVIASAEGPRGEASKATLLGLLDAIRTLSCRVCALGLEPRLIRSHLEIEDFDSPFLMQNIEVNKYLDDYGRLLTGETEQIEDARHLLVMLDQCIEVVNKVRKNALKHGTSIPLTYLLVALDQSIDRLRKLLFLVDISGELPQPPTVDLQEVASEVQPAANEERPVSLHQAAAIALALELIEAHNQRYAVRDLFRDNINLLARNVTENASRTGEHYVADTRRELRHMFGSSAGAGLVVGFMALFKILLSKLRMAPLVEGLVYGLNYGLGFVLIHVLHWTVATKQPAMTASRIAAELHSTDQRTIDVEALAELINKVIRTQFVAVLGNLITCIPTAYIIAVGWKLATGHHLVAPEKAMHLLQDVDPIHTPALFYAAIAGVWLFVAGLISGYYDNKAVYTQMAQRVEQLRWLRRLLGEKRRRRLALYLEDNLGGLMGNFYFGMLLGLTGAIGYGLGLPLDIRHITFSSANFATAFVGLNHEMSPELAATSIAGFLAIGLVNLIVSFGLALWVALRARRVRFRHGGNVVRALGRRFITTPLQFFIGPPSRAQGESS